MLVHKHKSLTIKKITPIFLFLIICLIFPILIFDQIRFYRLPVGNDVGVWLKFSFAIFENNYPAWGESPLQHGLLPFVLIYPLSKVFGEIWGVEIIGLAFLGLRTLAVFVFANEAFKNKYLAILCSTIDGFFPSYYNMYGFGGYPNLLGFVLLPITFKYILCVSRESSFSLKSKELIMLLIFAVLTCLSHHLTSIVLLTTVGFWFFCEVVTKNRRNALLVLLIVVSSFGISLFFTKGFSEYVFFNEFAYYGNVIGMSKILYVFKDLIFLTLLSIPTILGIIGLSKVNRDATFLLTSWLTSPILFYFGTYYTHLIAIDYPRLLFFVVQPLVMGAVYSLKTLWRRKSMICIFHRLHVSSFVTDLFALILGCSLITFSFGLGYVTMNKSIMYNRGVLESKYSDQNSYNLIIWIKENLSENSTIAVRAHIIGRLIEGVSHKRVLIGGTSPRFLFKLNEYERLLACEVILTGNTIGFSDMFKVKDQTPILFDRTPFIYIFGGDNYELLGYFQDHYPWELTKLTSNVTQISTSNNSYRVVYSGSYANSSLYYTTTKEVILKNDELQVEYHILNDPYKVLREKLGKLLYSNFWLPLGKDWEFKDNHTLITDYGDVEVITNAISVQKEYVPQWKQWRLVFSFNDELSVTFKVKNIRMVKRNVVLMTRDDLIKQYGVTHALVRVDDKEAMKWIQSTDDWKLIYNNTLFYLYSLDKNNH